MIGHSRSKCYMLTKYCSFGRSRLNRFSCILINNFWYDSARERFVNSPIRFSPAFDQSIDNISTARRSIEHRDFDCAPIIDHFLLFATFFVRCNFTTLFSPADRHEWRGSSV